MGIGKALKSNDPYQDSVAAVQANQAAIEALGDPIDIIGWFPGGFGGLPGGNLSITNGKGEVNFDIKVSGPKGAGTVSVIGTKANGKWTYQTWELKVDGQEKAIPLGK